MNSELPVKFILVCEFMYVVFASVGLAESAIVSHLESQNGGKILYSL